MNTQSSQPESKVLIVGGGPSGLVLALSLLQNGIPVRIIEKNSLPRLGQRGAAIMPRSLELFTYLRMIEPVMRKAILTPPVRMYKSVDGVQVSHEFEMSPRSNPTPTSPFLNAVMLGQDKLEKIFHAALAEYGCFVELGTELISFKQSESSVEVNLIKRGLSQDMSSGTSEVMSYDWMVGTDGARGVVRKQLGLSFLGETRAVENFVVGDIMVEGLAQKYWHIWGDPSATLVSLRGTETPNLFNFVLGGKHVNHTELSADEELLKECFWENTGRQSHIKFQQIPWMSHYRPNIRMVEKMGSGRVYIAGDAGHVHSPTGGQGMNTGIQDSFNIGWKLALVIKGLASPSLLQSYSDERIPIITGMIAETTQLLKKTLEGDETAWKRSGSLYQLDIHYRSSPVVIDERKEIELRRLAEEEAYLEDFGFDEDDEDDEDVERPDADEAEFDDHLRAGDRAPDSSGLVIRLPSSLLKQTCQLFQIFGASHHTVLIFSDLVNCRAVLASLSKYPRNLVHSVIIAEPRTSIPAEATIADFVVEDRGNHARLAYCSSGVCGIIVVRPDGFVGAIVKGPIGLTNYFHTIFAARF